MTNRELIIEIGTKLDALEKQFSNHLSHHFKANILAWSVALSAIVTLVVLIIKQ